MEFLREKSETQLIGASLLLGALIYLPFLGSVHLFDWDEVNFAECAREMLVLGDFLRVHIDFAPFYEKPPFFFWLQALSMSVFGVTEFAARFPNAILGIFHLPFLYLLGKKIDHRTTGWIWAGLYTCTFLPNLYFQSGIIDPWFNFFIFLSIYFLFSLRMDPRRPLRMVAFSGIALGLAILTKGPAALLIVGLSGIALWIWENQFPLSFRQLLIWAGLSLIIPSIWFSLEYQANGPGFMEEFFQYQWRLLTTEDAGHGGFPGYHLVVLLIGAFPASVAALFYRRFQPGRGRLFGKYMVILFWVVFLLFSAVQSKIIHYTSLAYYPLTFLAAFWIRETLQQKKKIPFGFKLFFSILMGLWSGLLLVLPFLGSQMETWAVEYDWGPNAIAVLSTPVDWPWWLSIGGIPGLLLIGYVWKQSYFRINFLWVGGFLCLMTIQWILITVIPRVEAYSQRPIIEYYQSMEGEGQLILPWGFKTYADLFYTKKQPQSRRPTSIDQYLASDEQRPLQVVTKVHRRAAFEKEWGHVAKKVESRGEFLIYDIPK